MKVIPTRYFHSIIFRNIASFLAIVLLIVVPLVSVYLWDIEHSMSETLAAQLELVAQHASQLLEADEIARIQNFIWYETAEYERAVQALAGIEKRFHVDNAVIYRRLQDKRFVYVADGQRSFAINQQVTLHRDFPGTYTAANNAWESGVLGETRLFRSGESKWYQVNLPLTVGNRVVAVLMLNKFATPIALEIRKRQNRILLITLLVMAAGVLLRWYLTRRQLQPLLALRKASQEISNGNLDVEIPAPKGRSEIGELTAGFGKMVADLRASRMELEDHQRTLEKRIEKRTGEIRELLEAQHQHSEKLEAVGTLAGGIAHDFNNILTPIIGYTELTMAQLDDGGREHENMTRVMEAAHRARDLIAQILHFSRQSEDTHRPVKLDSLIKEVLRLMRSTLPKTIEILEELDKETSMVNANATKLHALLINLCVNASHAMPNGGTLRVSLEEVDLAEYRSQEGKTFSGCHARIRVTDTGTGISPEVMERLFEPFFTTKQPGIGTGLGLSAARDLVNTHGGFMEVQSQVGEGSTFSIHFPALKAPEEKDTVRLPPVPRGKETVLFVEDEPEIRMLGKILLDGLGYRVFLAENGLDALKRFQTDPESFDIVVADQYTPNMTGYSLFKKLHKLNPTLPFLITTGLPESVIEEIGDSGDRVPILQKPYTRDDLGRAVAAVLTDPSKALDVQEGSRPGWKAPAPSPGSQKSS